MVKGLSPVAVTWIDFRLQTSLICKNEKTTSCEKWLLGGVLQKKLSQKFLKIHREIPVGQPFSNTVKSFHAARLAILLNLLSLGFESKPFVDRLENGVLE